MAGGRSSSDSDKLRGLSDISGGAVATGFLTYSLKPLAFELKGQNIFGSPTIGDWLPMPASPNWSATPRATAR